MKRILCILLLVTLTFAIACQPNDLPKEPTPPGEADVRVDPKTGFAFKQPPQKRFNRAGKHIVMEETIFDVVKDSAQGGQTQLAAQANFMVEDFDVLYKRFFVLTTSGWVAHEFSDSPVPGSSWILAENLDGVLGSFYVDANSFYSSNTYLAVFGCNRMNLRWDCKQGKWLTQEFHVATDDLKVRSIDSFPYDLPEQGTDHAMSFLITKTNNDAKYSTDVITVRARLNYGGERPVVDAAYYKGVALDVDDDSVRIDVALDEFNLFDENGYAMFEGVITIDYVDDAEHDIAIQIDIQDEVYEGNEENNAKSTVLPPEPEEPGQRAYDDFSAQETDRFHAENDVEYSKTVHAYDVEFESVGAGKVRLFSANNPAMELNMLFDDPKDGPALSEVDGVTGDLDDFVDENLYFFDRPGGIVEARYANDALSMRLAMGSIADTLELGDTKVYPIHSQGYEVSVLEVIPAEWVLISDPCQTIDLREDMQIASSNDVSLENRNGVIYDLSVDIGEDGSSIFMDGAAFSGMEREGVFDLQPGDFFTIGNEGISRIMQYVSINAQDATMTFKDIGSGSAIDVSYVQAESNNCQVNQATMYFDGSAYVVEALQGTDFVRVDMDGSADFSFRPMFFVNAENELYMYKEVLGAQYSDMRASSYMEYEKVGEHRAKLMIDGEITPLLYDGDAYYVNENLALVVLNVLPTRPEDTVQHFVEFSIGYEVELDGATGEVRVNNQVVPDNSVEIDYSWYPGYEGQGLLLDSIDITWTPSEDVIIPMNGKLSDANAPGARFFEAIGVDLDEGGLLNQDGVYIGAEEPEPPKGGGGGQAGVSTILEVGGIDRLTMGDNLAVTLVNMAGEEPDFASTLRIDTLDEQGQVIDTLSTRSMLKGSIHEFEVDNQWYRLTIDDMFDLNHYKQLISTRTDAQFLALTAVGYTQTFEALNLLYERDPDLASNEVRMFKEGDQALVYRLVFDEPAVSQIVDSYLIDFNDKTFTIFGKEFEIVHAVDDSSIGLILEFAATKNVQSLAVGQSAQVTYEGEQYLVKNMLVAQEGCSIDCGTTPTCGDGILDRFEQCDDGNTNNGDGCSAMCTSEITCDVLDLKSRPFSEISEVDMSMVNRDGVAYTLPLSVASTMTQGEAQVMSPSGAFHFTERGDLFSIMPGDWFATEYNGYSRVFEFLGIYPNDRTISLRDVGTGQTMDHSYFLTTDTNGCPIGQAAFTFDGANYRMDIFQDQFARVDLDADGAITNGEAAFEDEHGNSFEYVDLVGGSVFARTIMLVDGVPYDATIQTHGNNPNSRLTLVEIVPKGEDTPIGYVEFTLDPLLLHYESRGDIIDIEGRLGERGSAISAVPYYTISELGDTFAFEELQFTWYPQEDVIVRDGQTLASSSAYGASVFEALGLDVGRDVLLDREGQPLISGLDESINGQRKLAKISLETVQDSLDDVFPPEFGIVDLSVYPYPFIDGLEHRGTIVVGDNAREDDIRSAQRIEGWLSRSPSYEDERGRFVLREVEMNPTKLASELTEQERNGNMILIGSPCVNTVMAELLGEAFDPSLCDGYRYDGLSTEGGIVFQMEHATGAQALIIWGYTPLNTLELAYGSTQDRYSGPYLLTSQLH